VKHKEIEYDEESDKEIPVRKRKSPKSRRGSLKRRKVTSEQEDDETYTDNKPKTTESTKKPSPQSSSRHKIAKSPPKVARYSPMRSRKQRKLEETKMFCQSKKNKGQASSKKVTFSKKMNSNGDEELDESSVISEVSIQKINQSIESFEVTELKEAPS
jgi:hypothetical protein